MSTTSTSIPYDDPFGAVADIQSSDVGVRVWDREKAWQGLTIFHTIVDNKIVVVGMDGSVLLEFTDVPEGYKLYRPGKAGDKRNVYCILISDEDRYARAIAAIADDGSIIWKTPHRHFTHDFHVRHNKRVVSVMRDERELGGQLVSDNVICDMDIRGNVSWQWSLLDNLHKFEFADSVVEGITSHGNDNPFHVNSIQIADYPCITDAYGEPGIVASARNMNSVFIIGQLSNEVLFEYSNQTLGQHHARVLPDDRESRKAYGASSGNLIIVDNGYDFTPAAPTPSRGYSRIVEVSLPDKETVWEYRSSKHQPDFFSPIVGGQHRLPNGNTLITQGYYGRVFEVDRAGEIVWDYVYPHSVPVEQHIAKRSLRETGLRQIYRAYRVEYDWMN